MTTTQKMAEALNELAEGFLALTEKPVACNRCGKKYHFLLINGVLGTCSKCTKRLLNDSN